MGLLRYAVFLVYIVFCFCDMNAHADETIDIGMSAAFRGPTGGLGIELYRGSMAYIHHINESGGINGKRIRIIAYDDGYNPTPAINNTIQLIEHDKIFALFGYVGTPTVTRILPILKSNADKNIFLFFPFTGAQPHRQPPYEEYVFNLRASYNQETAGLVDNFVKIGRKKIAVFYQADAYGRSGWNGVRIALAKYGLKIAGEATYRRGTDFGDSLLKQVMILRNSGADAVVSIGAYAACAAFIRDARDSGWEIPIAHVSFVGSEFMINLLLDAERRNGRNYTANLIYSQVVPNYEDLSLAAVREYRALMDASSQFPPVHLIEPGYKPLRYSFVSFEGYLNAKLLVEILKRMAPQFERKRIKTVVEGVRNLDIGIDTKVSFSNVRHQGLNRVYYTMYDGGRFVTISDWQRWRK